MSNTVIPASAAAAIVARARALVAILVGRGACSRGRRAARRSEPAPSRPPGLRGRTPRGRPPRPRAHAAPRSSIGASGSIFTRPPSERPRAGDEAIDEKRRAHLSALDDAARCSVRDDAPAIVVAQHEIVEAREESRRCERVAGWEELAAGRRARDRARPEASGSSRSSPVRRRLSGAAPLHCEMSAPVARAEGCAGSGGRDVRAAGVSAGAVRAEPGTRGHEGPAGRVRAPLGGRRPVDQAGARRQRKPDETTGRRSSISSFGRPSAPSSSDASEVVRPRARRAARPPLRGRPPLPVRTSCRCSSPTRPFPKDPCVREVVPLRSRRCSVMRISVALTTCRLAIARKRSSARNRRRATTGRCTATAATAPGCLRRARPPASPSADAGAAGAAVPASRDSARVA